MADWAARVGRAARMRQRLAGLGALVLLLSPVWAQVVIEVLGW